MPTILYDTRTSTGSCAVTHRCAGNHVRRRNRGSRLWRSGRRAAPHYARNPFIQLGLQKYYKMVRALLILSG